MVKLLWREKFMLMKSDGIESIMMPALENHIPHRKILETTTICVKSNGIRIILNKPIDWDKVLRDMWNVKYIIKRKCWRVSCRRKLRGTSMSYWLTLAISSDYDRSWVLLFVAPVSAIQDEEEWHVVGTEIVG